MKKISPYVNQTRNPAKEFPKGMIVMAIMVGLSAILGSVAMGMLFDGNNIPEDLMRNGAYQAFQMLGNSWGVGNLFVVIYALTNMVGQIAALAFSIDAPYKSYSITLTKTTSQAGFVNVLKKVSSLTATSLQASSLALSSSFQFLVFRKLTDL